MSAQNKSNKWIWISLAGGLAAFCLCAVVVGGVLFNRVGKQIQEGMKNDPISAAKAAHEIIDYDLPPGYQEQVAMDLLLYQMVMITPTQQSSRTSDMFIMIAQFSANLSDQQQTEEQIRQSFEQQSGRRGMQMKLIEVKSMTIRGQEATVSIFEGTDEQGTTIRQLLTTFPGKDGTAMLMIMGPPEEWDQDIVDAFLKSIR